MDNIPDSKILSEKEIEELSEEELEELLAGLPNILCELEKMEASKAAK